MIANPNHKRWLSETWEMIADCATGKQGATRRTAVNLSPEGCAALHADRAARGTLILRLRLALQSAWPYVYQHCTIETVRKEVLALMSSKEQTDAPVADRQTLIHGARDNNAHAHRLLEPLLFDFLCRKYVQRQDARQKEMNLQYTTAETHDLAAELSRFILTQAAGLDVGAEVVLGADKPADPQEFTPDV